MPSTENVTLQRIQREISEVIEREKELRNNQDHTENNNNNENNDVEETPHEEKTEIKQILTPTKTSHPLPNGNQSGPNGMRLFTPNPSTKGVMHKFIKSRGKLNVVSSIKNNATPVHSWTIPDFIEPPRVPVLEPGKFVRKGYVPIEERMRKEFQDYHNREMELRSERIKSQPDFNALVDIETPLPQSNLSNLRVTRSMAQLYDVDDYMDECHSAPSSLKPARSLAELCDASEDELETPGSHSLIMQWENLIRKNQQVRT